VPFTTLHSTCFIVRLGLSYRSLVTQQQLCHCLLSPPTLACCALGIEVDHIKQPFISQPKAYSILLFTLVGHQPHEDISVDLFPGVFRRGLWFCDREAIRPLFASAFRRRSTFLSSPRCKRSTYLHPQPYCSLRLRTSPSQRCSRVVHKLAKPYAEVFGSNSSTMAKLSLATLERMEGEYQGQSALLDARLTNHQKSAATA